jgi:ubiquinone/menaquinone biosynthesis C-methylase UbiE
MRQERTKEEAETLVAEVRRRYGDIASGRQQSCCGGDCLDAREVGHRLGYDQEAMDEVPDGANLNLGCGAPLEYLDLQPGEVVLDLGSGGGLDAFLAAGRVGPTGRVIGVDMTPEMIALASRNASEAGMSQVEFRQGRLEALPVDSGSIDAITSNCVINLVPHKSRVFREMARVLKAGGRLVIADVVAERELPPFLVQHLAAYVGCVAGAMERTAYFEALEAAGFESIEVLREVDAGELFQATAPSHWQAAVAGTSAAGTEVPTRGWASSLTYRARRASSR